MSALVSAVLSVSPVSRARISSSMPKPCSLPMSVVIMLDDVRLAAACPTLHSSADEPAVPMMKEAIFARPWHELVRRLIQLDSPPLLLS